jgi:hypothetical protein
MNVNVVRERAVSEMSLIITVPLLARMSSEVIYTRASKKILNKSRNMSLLVRFRIVAK